MTLLLIIGTACELKEPGAPKQDQTVPAAKVTAAPPAPTPDPCPFCRLYPQVAPTVVGVFGRGLEIPARADAFQEFVRRHYGEVLPLGVGSGVIVDPTGLVLTNHHVVEGAAQISVLLHDNRLRAAVLVGADPALDLALLRVEGGESYTPARLGTSRKLRVGQPVAALGNPAGLAQTFTTGVVSALDRRAESVVVPGLQPGVGYLQTDAALSRGSSGAPLFDRDGRVIGLACMVHATAAGVGFAIPADTITAALPRLRAGVQDPAWLGVRLVPVIGPPEGQSVGLLVEEVLSGSPAATAGLLVGDVVVSLGDTAVRERAQFVELLAAARPGQAVELVVERGLERLMIAVVPGRRPAQPE